MLISGCAATKVRPGWVGIKVNNYGSRRGVEAYPIVTGMVWYNPFSEDVYKFPTFLQNVVWTQSKDEGESKDQSITFNSVEGATINADIALSYSILPEKVPTLFVKFRQSAEDITRVYMRSQVRDAFSRHASKMKVTDIFGEGKQQLLVDVKKDLNDNLGKEGFNFDMISFVGALRVGEDVKRSIDAVISATQRAIEAENKIRQSKAEAEQKVAEANGDAQSILLRAKAQAQANQIINASMTPALIQWQKIQKWDGHAVGKYVSGGTPIISMSGDSMK